MPYGMQEVALVRSTYLSSDFSWKDGGLPLDIVVDRSPKIKLN